jgi:hypothetical protein
MVRLVAAMQLADLVEKGFYRSDRTGLGDTIIRRNEGWEEGEMQREYRK